MTLGMALQRRRAADLARWAFIGFMAACGAESNPPPASTDTIRAAVPLPWVESPASVETDTLESPRILDGDYVRISAIAIVGNSIVVADRGRSPHLAIVDVPSGRVVHRTLVGGHAPRRDPWCVGVRANDPKAVWVVDNYSQRLLRVPLRESRRWAADDSISMSPSQATGCAFWLGHDIVAAGNFDRFSLAVLDPAGSLRHVVVGAPPFDSTYMAATGGLRTMNGAVMAVEPSQLYTAVAFRRESRILVFDSSFALRAAIRGPRRIRAEGRWDATLHGGAGGVIFPSEGSLAYVAVAATPRRLYALFAGRRLSDSLSREIHVFDWSGRLIRAIVSPRPIATFAVTSDDETLVGALTIDDRAQSRQQIGLWSLARRRCETCS